MSSFKTLLQNPLFKGIPESDLPRVLEYLSGKTAVYPKGATIYRVGDSIAAISILLSGSVHIVKYDIWGNAHLIQRIGIGDFFAETYACQSDITSLVDVVAAEESEILFIGVGKILGGCVPNSSFNQVMAKNLLQILAVKNLNLIKKIELITPKNIRERILAYLSFQRQRSNRDSFDIPFNRQQLADYLLVDRSALSATLSQMQKEGLIAYRKNHFTIKKPV